MKKARGLKRTCQNAECELRFYDLGRDSISCPTCGAAFVPPIAAAPAPPRRRWSAKPTAPIHSHAVEPAAEVAVEAEALVVADDGVDDGAEVALPEIDDIDEVDEELEVVKHEVD
ncbi:MAG: TIGR02300 family protein [Hyphomicrobiaceae bacterium]|jgi:uncharacterized protein (TIGR02300 family)